MSFSNYVYIVFLGKLTLLALLLTVGLAGIQGIGVKQYIAPVTWYNLWFFFLLTAGIFFLGLQGVLHEEHHAFMYYFFGGIMLKLLIAIVYLFVVLYFYVSGNPAPFLISFLLFYVVFTTFEVVYLLKIQHKDIKR